MKMLLTLSLLVLVSPLAARPQDRPNAADDWSITNDVKDNDADDLIVEDNDSWRAFDKQVESTARWWEETMDDDLWLRAGRQALVSEEREDAGDQEDSELKTPSDDGYRSTDEVNTQGPVSEEDEDDVPVLPFTGYSDDVFSRDSYNDEKPQKISNEKESDSEDIIGSKTFDEDTDMDNDLSKDSSAVQNVEPPVDVVREQQSLPEDRLTPTNRLKDHITPFVDLPNNNNLFISGHSLGKKIWDNQYVSPVQKTVAKPTESETQSTQDANVERTDAPITNSENGKIETEENDLDEQDGGMKMSLNIDVSDPKVEVKNSKQITLKEGGIDNEDGVVLNKDSVNLTGTVFEDVQNLASKIGKEINVDSSGVLDNYHNGNSDKNDEKLSSESDENDELNSIGVKSNYNSNIGESSKPSLKTGDINSIPKDSDIDVKINGGKEVSDKNETEKSDDWDDWDDAEFDYYDEDDEDDVSDGQKQGIDESESRNNVENNSLESTDDKDKLKVKSENVEDEDESDSEEYYDDPQRSVDSQEKANVADSDDYYEGNDDVKNAGKGHNDKLKDGVEEHDDYEADAYYENEDYNEIEGDTSNTVDKDEAFDIKNSIVKSEDSDIKNDIITSVYDEDTKESTKSTDAKFIEFTTKPSSPEDYDRKHREHNDFAGLLMPSEDSPAAIDETHFSHGTIYDTDYPHSKSQTKKHTKKHTKKSSEELVSESEQPSYKHDDLKNKPRIRVKRIKQNVSEKSSQINNGNTPHNTYEEQTDLKKNSATNSFTSYHKNNDKKSNELRINTESDVSTSPNPAPSRGERQRSSTTVEASREDLHDDHSSHSSQQPESGSSQSSQISEQADSPRSQSSQQINSRSSSEADESDAMKNEEFVEALPIENCETEAGCRAGRTCVAGVCRCYTSDMCVGHHKPVCGSDGREYSSHCHLHRTACVTRTHIRVDRHARCLQPHISHKEKSWLMEEERLVQENRQKQNVKDENEVHIAHHEIIEFPQNLKSESRTVDVKKSYMRPDSTNDEKESADNEQSLNESTKQKKECTWKKMNEFKEALLMYRCEKFEEPNCQLEVETDRQYLAMLIFSNYDTDVNFVLTSAELEEKEKEENFTGAITEFCHLVDFVRFVDTDRDGKITVSEFSDSFKKAAPQWSEPFHVEVVTTVALTGDGLELKCAVDADHVVWKRHNTPLADDTPDHDLMVFEDGSLYFSTVALHHIGNYTCLDAENSQRAQVHQLRVHSLPLVTVSPVTQTHMAGSNFLLYCVARGVPQPSVSWSKGQEVIRNNAHTILYYDGGHMAVHDAQDVDDSGSYTCHAHNQAGTSDKSVSVSILTRTSDGKSDSYQVSRNDKGKFLVFNSEGIKVFKPSSCASRQVVPTDFTDFRYKPLDAVEPLSLCPHGRCNWTQAVRAGPQAIYVIQAEHNRVVIFDSSSTLRPREVVSTDRSPRRLWYVEHLDQVWLLCGDSEEKTIEVISDARQPGQHRAVHTQPVGNHFDTVENLFIAPQNDLRHEFAFGYVSHSGKNNLLKLGLEDMAYTKAIDLSSYNCHPQSMAFVPIGGHVIIECVSPGSASNLQIVLDHVTDTVTSAITLPGQPMVSPDSRHMITVDKRTGKVVVTAISDQGVMERTYEVTVSASISDVSFVPAFAHYGYDLVLTSASDDDVIIMNLITGKVEKMAGSTMPEPASSWPPTSHRRPIVSGDTISNVFMAPSRSSLAILNSKYRQVECEYDSTESEVAVYISSERTS